MKKLGYFTIWDRTLNCMPPVIVTSTTYNGNHERFELSRYTIPTLSTEVTSIQQLRIQWDTWDHCEPLNSTCDLFAKRLEANDVPVTIPCSESGLLAVNPRSVMDTESSRHFIFHISYTESSRLPVLLILKRTARWIQGKGTIINLIPWNVTQYFSPSKSSVIPVVLSLVDSVSFV